ncbi:hypothetical protein [Bacillus swezeyi]|uniref:Uncharacterized protein n=1 Tax=Bacillus swezeyi TaxID=1925020 RepID=A0A5M8RU16_9BACI|nr:hypothetical protein [Bacillus swezeyi]KAA6450978.1 hypothetical protein DX927_09105 [Bacillus swezeyi]
MAVKITSWSLTPESWAYEINPSIPEEVQKTIAESFAVEMNIEISFSGEINDTALPEKILKAIEEVIEKENADNAE